ncbi:MAG: ATP-dependent helicase [Spirochaetota bacterium]|nr:ATP-dependent helicase [Spirochaetota bacterium]
MESISFNFTEAQTQAIEDIDNNILLISGPGTGKTSVIAAKVAFLLTHGYQPDEILVTTFTNKATDELKSRVAEYCEPKGIYPHHLEIHTIHSFCRNIIREFGYLIDPQADFKLLDDIDQKFLVLEHYEKFGLSKNSFVSDEKFYKTIFYIFGLFDSFNENLIEPKNLRAYTDDPHYGAASFNLAREQGVFLKDREIVEIYHKYRRFMWDSRWLDHSQALKLAHTIISGFPDVQTTLWNRFRYILVDEYQDTSYLQHEIFRHLAAGGSRICAVGDDDQGIYHFRGATVHNLHSFETDFPGVRVLKIEENFRSTENIVLFNNSIIERCQSRFDKDLYSSRGAGAKVCLIEKNTPKETASAICDTIKILLEQDIISSYSEVAVLCRSVRWGFIGQGYLDIFNMSGIPTLIHKSGGFFQRGLISLLMELMLFLTQKGKLQIDRFTAILEQLLITEDSILSFVEHQSAGVTHADLSPKGLAEKNRITHSRDLQKLTLLYDLSQSFAHQENTNVLDLIYQLFHLGDIFHKIASSDSPDDFYQLAYLTRLVQSHENWGGDGLNSFVERLKIFRDKRTLEEVPVEEERDAVIVSTIHSSKGLQYPVVFVCDFDPSESWSGNFHVPNALLKHAPEKSTPLDNQYRLFYVALTRAEDYLFLAYSKNNNWGKPKKDKPFIREALEDATLQNHDLESYSSESRLQGYVSDRKLKSISISHTDLQVYRSCPLRYQYQTVYGFRTVKSQAALFGTFVHKLLEKMLSMRQSSQTVTEAVIDSLMEDQSALLKSLSSETRDQRLIEARTILYSYLREYMPEPQDIVSVEESFEVFLSHHRLLGAMDLILKNGSDTVEIIDFKTGKPDDTVIDQLHIYALAYRLESRQVSVSLKAHYLRTNEVISYPFQPEKLTQLEDLIIETCQRIADKDFSPSPSPASCSLCGFRDLCPHTFSS